jgi:hypothetical protein
MKVLVPMLILMLMLKSSMLLVMITLQRVRASGR